MDIRIRICGLSDVEPLVYYALKLAFDTEDKTLDKDLVTLGVTNLIKAPKLGTYYLAEVKQGETWKHIGTTMVSFEMQPRLGGLIHMIQSVYVDAEYRGKGVFRKLYEKCCEVAKEDPKTLGVRLYVDHDNFTAMTVYEKLGMGKMDTWAFDEKDMVF